MSATALSRFAGSRRPAVAALLGLLLLLGPAPTPAAATPRSAPGTGRYDVSAAPVSGTGKLDPALPRTGAAKVDVVVSGLRGQSSAVARAVRDQGGTVTAELPVIHGVRASVPAGGLTGVASSSAVTAVTKNRTMRFQGISYDTPATGSNFARSTGATSLWARDRLGQGVGVAVLDTGVSPMNDLSGRIVHGPDLSGEGTIVDSYGHGTVMAGIIAGNGADSAARAGGPYTGIAPKATVVAVKVAGRNGATDVSTVLQGMHWVSAYKKQFNIRVLNLAWGTPSTQSPALDPLNYAVERLWQQGIVVVAAAGNDGPRRGTVLKPGDDPLVLTVGGYDDKQNLDPRDDSLPRWSSRGPTAHGYAKPDLVAPGRTLIVTRSFGSAVETENPKALLSPSYIKGSGTSEAAAVTSGAAALLLQARPGLTPDQVKHLLTSGASSIAGLSASEQGAGRLNVVAALSADPGAAVRQQPIATGLGSIEASRGGRNVEADCGEDGTVELITGEIDVRCETWDPQAWTGGAWTGAAWTGGAWTGGAWTGGAWTGGAWTGAAWTGGAWTGAAWTGAAWTGAAWTGGAWTSAEYGDETFLTAWWGGRPAYGKKVAGEESEPRPCGPPAECPRR
ncbi:MAG: serine protease AprX [Kribbellaceae bacterium]|nr:serine protease AprX [Kribbellaceae bacterium]